MGESAENNPNHQAKLSSFSLKAPPNAMCGQWRPRMREAWLGKEGMVTLSPSILNHYLENLVYHFFKATVAGF